MHWKPTDLWLEQANTIVLANEFMNSAPLVSFVPQQVLIFVCMFVHVYSVLSDSLWPVDCSPPGSSPWDFPGKYSRVDCHFLLQEIFPTQKSNLHFLHWEMDSFPLSHLALFEPQRYQKPPHQLLYSCCICLPPSRKWPHLASSPSARLDTLYLVLNVLGFTSLPPHEIIMGKKSNKPITSSQGNQASPHLITMKPVSQSSCLFIVLPSGPPPLGCEYTWLINSCQSHLSRARCHVFGHPQNLRVGLPLSPIRWRGGKQNSKLCHWVVAFKVNLPS